jgi:protein-L-isoaspartate(D-aspartate) O-methyltransferase
MRWTEQDPAVRLAIHAVQRELFVPRRERALAAQDNPLPIGCGQTISQPSLVAYMTEQLRLDARSRVLEIGTGSGYQTAILAEIAATVFTIERIDHLGRAAAERLRRLGYVNIRFRVGDGARGWAEEAPFNAIIVTAAAERMPAPLIEQLQCGGRLVAPVGSVSEDNQELMLLEKDVDGSVRTRKLCDVRFVPLITDVASG